MDTLASYVNHLPMAKRPPDPPPRRRYHPLPIIEWIEFLGLTQRKVAEDVGISESHLSLIAAGKRPYNQRILEAIAESLGIHPAQLHHPPTERPLWQLINELDSDQQRTAKRLLEALKSSK